ncbi:MAG: GNAT family N-acetyltransferase [Clostridia bacterium]|nr:GNAT family N-acetyltransferase [Clostridia bacterium]
MNRKIYVEENGIALAEYVFELDERDIYDCWCDEATESGYNGHAAPTYEEHLKIPISSTKIMIMKDKKTVGCLLLSPPECEPDLAIIVYPDFRSQGIGTAAFSLGLKYCFEKYGFDYILAGCMEGNEISRKMLVSCGMIPHPEGNVIEKHYLTGEDRIMYDFVKYRNEIKPVEVSDIPECVAVIRNSFKTVADEFGFTEENAPRFTAFAVNEDRLLYHLNVEKRPMFKYVEGGRIIGYYSLLINDSECELNNLCVLPEFRHRGLGKELLEDAFKESKRAGCAVVKIGIVEENTVLKKWYEGFGFRHTNCEKYDFFPFTCGYMERKI